MRLKGVLSVVLISVSRCGAPARNRTSNNGLEVRSYIHLTTGASEEQKVKLGNVLVPNVDPERNFLAGAT